MQRILARLARYRAGRGAVTLGLIACYPVMLAAAALSTEPGGRAAFAAAALACYAAELAAPDAAPALVSQLNWLQVGAGLRTVLRQCALMILLARTTDVDPPQFAILAVGLFGLHAVRAAYSSMVIYVIKRRQLPAVTRNVDLAELQIPDGPSRLLTANHSWRLLFLDAPAVAGGIVTAFTANYDWVTAGFAAGIAAGAAGCAVMAPHFLRHRRLPGAAGVLAVVGARLREYDPEVVLYFTGARDAIYQVNMWLPALARLDRRALIVIRERWLLELLGRTDLPVVCVDDNAHLADLPLPGVRVVLYPANNARNIHMLQRRGMSHVFIGHGDSDKAASTNPFSKAYDQIWVAGQAGKDRYLRAGVGVRAEDIRMVGRPQLAELGAVFPGEPASQARQAGQASQARQAGPRGPVTVLYAPTWEGRDSSDSLSLMSTVVMGPQIVRALVSDDRVRVLYRPHPLTGTEDPRARRADREIVAIIEQANRSRQAARPGPGAAARPSESPADADLADADLAAIESRLRALAHAARPVADPARQGWPDYAGMSRDAAPDPGSAAEFGRLTAAWSERYWDQDAHWQHRVMAGQLPGLYDTFGHCDLMISDISSVVSDFIATGKPYVVTNPAGQEEQQFRAAYPSASAGYLLAPDCAALAAILDEAAGPGPDRLAPARLELRAYLLGPDPAGSQALFNAAVGDLMTLANLVPAARVPVAG